jgi:hypothetical protein
MAKISDLTNLTGPNILGTDLLPIADLSVPETKNVTVSALRKPATATDLIGYAAGSGGAVTQITSASTGVTIDKPNGRITTVALTTAAGAEEVFTVSNSLASATTIPVVGTTYAGAGTISVTTKKSASGAFDIVIANKHATDALNALVVINFALIEIVAS